MAETITLHISRHNAHEQDLSYEEDPSLLVNVSLNGETNVKSYVQLKDDDFIEAAGLQRSGTSGRKSSVEKLLEESLNTAEPIKTITSARPASVNPLLNGGTSDSDDDGTARRRGRYTEKPQNLKSDKFIDDAGLSRTGEVPKKSSMEKLLENQLQTAEEIKPRMVVREDDSGNHYIVQQREPGPGPRKPQRTTNDEQQEEKPKSDRKSSIYAQKSIDAPVLMKGNQIKGRTENLFKQYEKDVSGHEPKPLINVNNETALAQRRESYNMAASEEERRKVDVAREEKEKELLEARKLYQERLAEEERQEAEERNQRIASQELKCARSLGDAKNRYLAIAKGEVSKHSDSEADETVQHAQVDPNGGAIEKGGGKIEIVRSSDGVGNIRNKFGSIGKAGWKKRNLEGEDTDQVDSCKVDSARSLFQSFESKKETLKSFNRPTSRKVKDPKQLMEMRKKVTYGDEEELPQDGLVKKSVVLDENELGASPKKYALNLYKSLGKKTEDNVELQRPTNRLLSDDEALLSMDEKRTVSSSASESSEVDEVVNDINADVSGYGSGTPCSPTSTMSDDYGSLPAEEVNVNEADAVIDLPDENNTLDLGKSVNVRLGLSEEVDASVLINGHVQVTSDSMEYV